MMYGSGKSDLAVVAVETDEQDRATGRGVGGAKGGGGRFTMVNKMAGVNSSWSACTRGDATRYVLHSGSPTASPASRLCNPFRKFRKI
jgi:hypothetical protein